MRAQRSPWPAVLLAAALLAAAAPGGADVGSQAFRGRFDGYDAAEVAFALVALDAPEDVPLPDDNMTEQIELGFATRFWDDPTAQFWVGSNGFVSLFRREAAGCCEGQPLPHPDDPDGLVAGFWTDLDPAAGGRITFQRFSALAAPGLPAQPAVVVDYADVPGPSGVVSLQVRLYQEGAVEVHIAHAAVPPGTKASVGIENFNGLRGVQVLHGDALSVTERAWRFTPLYTPLVPDLVIPGLTVAPPTQPTVPWTLRVTLGNDGLGTADQSQVRLVATPTPGPLRGTSPGCPELVGTKLVNGLQPGGRINLTFTWAPPVDLANPSVPHVGEFRFDASAVVIAAAEPEEVTSNNAANATGAYLLPGLGGSDVLCTPMPVDAAAPGVLP